MRRGGYPDDWDDRRESVLARDDYTCQQCGATDATLQVHHKTPISEGGSHKLTNLETVCRSCHASEHPTKVKLSTALSDERRIRMKYSSSTGTRVREFDPYGMAMHEGIQYVVGYDYYRNEIRIFRPSSIKWIEVLEESFTVPHNWDTKAYLKDEMGYSRSESDGCFIATAAYGTALHEDLDTLRNFRDRVLRQHWYTRWVVFVYYKLSPPIAEWIRRRKSRQRAVRAILEPIVWIVGCLCKECSL